MYHGENRNGGGILTYYINKPEVKKSDAKTKAEDKKSVKFDSVKFEIFDGDRQIRTLKFKAPKENGIHKTTWYLREKGVDRPSRSIRKSTREPAGVTVKPGTYKVKMTFGDVTSEQNIKVEFDPRLTISEEAINQKYNASKELESYQAKIAVTQRLSSASRYVGSRFGLQTATEKQLMNQFKEAYKKAVSDTNSFFNNDWVNYKSSVENINISPFKEVKIYSQN